MKEILLPHGGLIKEGLYFVGVKAKSNKSSHVSKISILI